MKKKTGLFLTIIIVFLIVATVASAKEDLYFLKEGNYLNVEFAQKNRVVARVITELEKDGWVACNNAKIPPGTKMDTWCKMSVTDEEIIVECYTADRTVRMIIIRKSVQIQEVNYSPIPKLITTLFAEHRKATECLRIK